MAETAAKAEKPAGQGKADYRQNLNLDNRAIQEGNDARLKEMYKQPQRKGVEVQKAQ